MSWRSMGNYNGVAGESFQCCLTYSLVGASSFCVGNWQDIFQCFAGSASQLHSWGSMQILCQQVGTTKHKIHPRFRCYIIARMVQKDPDGCEVTVWIDTSSLAISVVVKSGDLLIEDACWLQPAHEDKHINLAELDAMLKGINLALQWKATVLHLKTDSACVHQWVTDALSGKAWIRTKASEMLIRRQLSTLKELVVEYELTVNVEFVRSQVNQADQLTRVPQWWLDVLRKETEPVCAASMEEQESTQEYEPFSNVVDILVWGRHYILLDESALWFRRQRSEHMRGVSP